ncbi:MAG: ABC transporter permease subunit [Anaerolineales bacterium]|nr:ABC transporter permease subunit [Anaerolineales bacterium]
MATTSPNLKPGGPKEAAIPFWRDVRILGVIGQVIFIALVLMGLGWLIANFIENSAIQGLQLGFEFINTTAAFDIAEGIAYESTDTFGRALWVGLVNTIRVSIIGIILTTILGLVTGIARLSNHWLISKIATIYVETIRNIPLPVQLFFIYFGVVLKLPSVRNSVQPFGWPVYLNQRGVALPSLVATASFPIWLAFVVLAVILVLVLWLLQTWQEEKTGKSINKIGSSIVAFLLVVGIGWWVTTNFSSNQAIMVASSRKITSFDDFEKIYLVKIDKDALQELGVDRTTVDRLTSTDAVAALRAEFEAQLEAIEPEEVEEEAVPEAQAAGGTAENGAEGSGNAAANDEGTDEAVSEEEGAEPVVSEATAAQIDVLESRLDVLNDPAIIVCALEGTPAAANAASQLRQRNVPIDDESERTMARAAAAYADGDCDLLTGTEAELAAQRAILEEPDQHEIVPIDAAPLIVSIPAPSGFNIQGGTKLSPEFFALLAGLVIYTGAFASEIVRAGILAVSKGQSEAARALGLSEGQRLRLIVLPQALRVIIPPMTSQYLNLTKNSSLAIAIGYPDLVAVGNTVLNQSGYAVQVVIIFMISYLSLSLIISAFLNWYNKKVALVER